MLKSFNFISVSTVFTAIFLLISSQLVELKSQTLRSDYTWEVGFDVLPIIADTSYHMRESILIKYKLNRNLKLRGRFGVYFDNVKNENNHPESARPSTITGFRPRFYFSGGIENSIFYSEKVNIALGIDLFLFHKRNKIEQGDGNLERFINNSETKIGSNLVLNGEYLISNNFAINIEAYWQFAYRHQRNFNEEFQSGNLAQFGANTITRFLTQLQPISSVNLIYKF